MKPSSAVALIGHFPQTPFDKDRGALIPLQMAAPCEVRMLKVYEDVSLEFEAAILKQMVAKYAEGTKTEEESRLLRVHSFFLFNEKKLTLELEAAPDETLQGLLLKSQVANKKGIEESEAMFIVGNALIGVDHLHSLGLAHSNINPGAILLYRKPPTISGSWTVKVVDPMDGFLMVSNTHHENRNFVRYFAGKVHYLSPETLVTYLNPASPLKTSSGQPADIWALGTVLFESLHGFLPFASAPTDGQARQVWLQQLEFIKSGPRLAKTFTTSQVDMVLSETLMARPENRIDSFGALRLFKNYTPNKQKEKEMELNKNFWLRQ